MRRGEDFDGVDESLGVSLRGEVDGEGSGGGVDEEFFEDGRGLVVGGEAVEEDVLVDGDGEDGGGEVILPDVDGEEVEAEEEEARTVDPKVEGRVGGEDDGREIDWRGDVGGGDRKRLGGGGGEEEPSLGVAEEVSAIGGGGGLSGAAVEEVVVSGGEGGGVGLAGGGGGEDEDEGEDEGVHSSEVAHFSFFNYARKREGWGAKGGGRSRVLLSLLCQRSTAVEC